MSAPQPPAPRSRGRRPPPRARAPRRFSGLAAGIAIGIAGDAGVRAVAKQEKMYVGMVLVLIFAEALGLYGLIIGLIMASNESTACGGPGTWG